MNILDRIVELESLRHSMMALRDDAKGQGLGEMALVYDHSVLRYGIEVNLLRRYFIATHLKAK